MKKNQVIYTVTKDGVVLKRTTDHLSAITTFWARGTAMYETRKMGIFGKVKTVCTRIR